MIWLWAEQRWFNCCEIDGWFSQAIRLWRYFGRWSSGDLWRSVVGDGLVSSYALSLLLVPRTFFSLFFIWNSWLIFFLSRKALSSVFVLLYEMPFWSNFFLWSFNPLLYLFLSISSGNGFCLDLVCGIRTNSKKERCREKEVTGEFWVFYCKREMESGSGRERERISNGRLSGFLWFSRLQKMNQGIIGLQW